MFGSSTIEIIIGIIFVFILVSTICTAIREGIEAKLKTRAAYLEQGIRQLLDDPAGTGLAKSLYTHPLIASLFNLSYKPGKNNKAPDLLARGNDLPSYIPSKNFARALMDIAAKGVENNTGNTGSTAPVISLENIRSNVALIGNPHVQRALLNAVDMAQGDLNQAQANIETWFNSSMDRVSGWYKRSTQWIIFWIGLSVAVFLNINTLTIINYLSKNDTARKVIVERAAALSNDGQRDSLNYEKAQSQLEGLKLPIGWPDGIRSAKMNDNPPDFWNSFLGPLLGWLITGLAATIGAPYWFDLLNKVMVIRSTVKPHEKSGEEASQDARSKTPTPVILVAPAPAGETDNTGSPKNTG